MAPVIRPTLANQFQLKVVQTGFELNHAIKVAQELQDFLLQDDRTSIECLEHSESMDRRLAEDDSNSSDHLEDGSSTLEIPMMLDSNAVDLMFDSDPLVTCCSVPATEPAETSISAGPSALPPALPILHLGHIGPPIPRAETQSAFKHRRSRRKKAGTTNKRASNTASKLAKAADRVIQTKVDIAELEPGTSMMGCEQKIFTLEELKKQHFQEIEWDGMWVIASSP